MERVQFGQWRWALCIGVWLSAAVVSAAQFTGRCVAVSDGDAITVLIDTAPTTIRLHGIDCPERRQDFGTRAREFTSGLAFGKAVRVVDHGKDRYGRTIGRVYVGDVDVSLELVRAGLAWHYKKYSTEQALADAEQEARDARRGLWSQSGPVPPWDFRHR